MAEEGEAEKPVRWVNHYSSMQEILIVGDGDFSFSLSLANGFGTATNIVATSLDSHDVLLKKYNKAKRNLESLEKMGAAILHGVDATKLKLYADLKMRKFDRIVFNFPHAGFKGKEDQIHLINLHKKLVSGFLRNARHMLRPHGEVNISHKIGGPFCKWNLEELAAKNSLVLVERVNFSIKDYPGYNNKRGDGSKCDKPFPLGKCCTYKFRIGHVQKKRHSTKPVFPFGSPSSAAPGVVMGSRSSGSLPAFMLHGGRPMTQFLGTPITSAPRMEMINQPWRLPEDLSNENTVIQRINPYYVRANEDQLHMNEVPVRTIMGNLRYDRRSIMRHEELHRMLLRLDQEGRGPV